MPGQPSYFGHLELMKIQQCNRLKPVILSNFSLSVSHAFIKMLSKPSWRAPSLDSVKQWVAIKATIFKSIEYGIYYIGL